MIFTHEKWLKDSKKILHSIGQIFFQRKSLLDPQAMMKIPCFHQMPVHSKVILI